MESHDKIEDEEEVPDEEISDDKQNCDSNSILNSIDVPDNIDIHHTLNINNNFHLNHPTFFSSYNELSMNNNNDDEGNSSNMKNKNITALSTSDHQKVIDDGVGYSYIPAKCMTGNFWLLTKFQDIT